MKKNSKNGKYQIPYTQIWAKMSFPQKLHEKSKKKTNYLTNSEKNFLLTDKRMDRLSYRTIW